MKQETIATTTLREEFMAGLRESPAVFFAPAVFFWRWLHRVLMDMLPPRQEPGPDKRRVMR